MILHLYAGFLASSPSRLRLQGLCVCELKFKFKRVRSSIPILGSCDLVALMFHDFLSLEDFPGRLKVRFLDVDDVLACSFR